ncbi:hypothetical protein PAXY110619_14835 [Paenibacillus xylanexedens]|uniref:Uncharacterized protein n=1 Tax=Paenibacillus xylanexedens TaxID=528191 RepID=A0ABS4RQT1_PAEXY|nr:hypothetical protein [Paenibacillus xylanexedens]
MIYWWFDDMNPLFAVLVLCPIIAACLEYAVILPKGLDFGER